MPTGGGIFMRMNVEYFGTGINTEVDLSQNKYLDFMFHYD